MGHVSLPQLQVCYNFDVPSLQACWHQEPDKRPTFESVIASLRVLLLKTNSKRGISMGMTHSQCMCYTCHACLSLAVP